MKQCFSAAAISSYHGDGAADAVSPVQVTMDPVKSDAFGSTDIAADHYGVMSGVFSRVYLSSVDLLVEEV